MQRIIQINIAGRVISIEENAYSLLNDYISALERQFAGEEGNDEIIQDIEYRIAELFSIAMENGTVAINKEDVQKVIDTLGPASEIGGSGNANTGSATRHLPVVYAARGKQEEHDREQYGYRRIYRDPHDKMIGGVCGGLARYFDVDPTIIRLIAVVLLLGFGIGLIAYIVAWIVIPQATTSYDMKYGQPMDFHEMAKNMQGELQDLKKRGEQMSRDLKDFFNKKK
jgi:phage shock protein PspC (stress-responsive transcriptional regulator)